VGTSGGWQAIELLLSDRFYKNFSGENITMLTPKEYCGRVLMLYQKNGIQGDRKTKTDRI
jgi:hypothetical protein